MSKSPLGGFNYHSVDQLLEEGIEMAYDRYPAVKDGENWGMWVPWKNTIYIYSGIRDTKSEDITIMHEWLHVYEDRILLKDFRESQIEWWAHFHLRRDQFFANYIRSFFPDFRA